MTATEYKILPERWAEVLARPLRKGAHAKLTEQENLNMCVMEATAYVAGLPWSDHPTCTCPTLTVFMINWNDALPSDAERDRLLKPLIPKLIGTRGSEKLAERRSYMALDWLIHVNTPKWLDLVPALHEHAKTLRALPDITDIEGALAAWVHIRLAQTDAAAARTAVWDVARNAARDARWTAVRDTTRSVTWGTTRTAARAAAWDAVVDVVWDAAWTAAWTAALDVRWDAALKTAQATLKPTVEWLQISERDLFERMLVVREPS
jgi:hypothetical protein